METSSVPVEPPRARCGRLAGRVAIITGAARGMGAAETELFAREGATVLAVDLLPAVDEIAASLRASGLDVVAHHADVRVEPAWQALVRSAEDGSGGLDILVNNAGIQGDPSPVDELSLDAWERVIDVNQTGSFLGIKHCAPAMRRRGGGSIIQVSSTFASRGVVGFAAYSASKAAVAGLARSAAMTYVADGIRVNSLHPGLIDTPMIALEAPVPIATIARATPMGRPGRAMEVAAAALFLASDEASFITGTELYVDGGYNACGQLDIAPPAAAAQPSRRHLT